MVDSGEGHIWVLVAGPGVRPGSMEFQKGQFVREPRGREGINTSNRLHMPVTIVMPKTYHLQDSLAHRSINISLALKAQVDNSGSWFSSLALVLSGPAYVVGVSRLSTGRVAQAGCLGKLPR